MIESTPPGADRSAAAGPPDRGRACTAPSPDPGETPIGGRESSRRRPPQPRARARGRAGAVLAIVAVSLLLAVGCTGTSASDAGSDAPGQSLAVDARPGEASARTALELGATVVDVRTPEEYAGGHVDGAVLIDVQAPSFDDEIAALDDSVTYVVYCRSGNRSAAAAEQMQDAGLTVLDGGSLGDMSTAGWPVAS